MRYFSAIAIIALLAGCVSTSGIVPIGEDSYMVSRSEKGFDTTGTRVKADALKEANAHCSSLGKTIKVLKAEQKDMVPFKSDAQATVEFSCVSRE